MRHIPAFQMDQAGQADMLNAVHAHIGNEDQADVIGQLAYVKPPELSGDRFRYYQEVLDQNVTIAAMDREWKDGVHALWVPESELAQSALVVVAQAHRLAERDIEGVRAIDRLAQSAIWLTNGKTRFDGWQFTPLRAADLADYE